MKKKDNMFYPTQTKTESGYKSKNKKYKFCKKNSNASPKNRPKYRVIKSFHTALRNKEKKEKKVSSLM